MTSLFSIIVALAMAFSSLGSFTADLEKPVTLEAQINIDADQLAALIPAQEGDGGATLQTAKLAADIVNAISWRATADKDAMELALNAGEDELISLGAKENEDGGHTIASSLLGDNAISVSADFIKSMMSQMSSSMMSQFGGLAGQFGVTTEADGTTNMGATAGEGEGSVSTESGSGTTSIADMLGDVDMEQIKKDSTEYSTALMTEIMSKIGEPEAGEYTVDGLVFTARTPINLSLEELEEISLTHTKTFLEKDSMKNMLSKFGASDAASGLSSALESIKNMPEEKKYNSSFAIYTADEETSYFCADIARDANEKYDLKAERIHIGTGTVAGEKVTYVNFDMSGKALGEIGATFTEDGAGELQGSVVTDEEGKEPERADFSVTTDGAGNAGIIVDAIASGMPVRLVINTVKADEDNEAATAEVFLNGQENALATLVASKTLGGELTTKFSGEEITTQPVEKLMDTEDTTVSTQLSLSLFSKLMTAVNTLKQHLPEESAAMLGAMLSSYMQLGTPTTTVPESEPAEVTEEEPAEEAPAEAVPQE